MKPVVIDKKCGASESICKALKACPVEAISYIEVDEPILDREVNCNTSPSASGGCGCSCDCGEGSNDCGGSPYGRIVIDYDKCTVCCICIDECCGNAIEMMD
jgi:formate hydrogenlyase subunit 6/NADH:ubiquinone oxidoreductase subunit I